MADSCMQCGAALGEHESFCTKCGARRSQSPPRAVEKHFCSSCGSELKPNVQFCEACGARIEQPLAVLAGSAAANGQGSQGAAFSSSPGPTSSAGTAPGFQPVQIPNMAGGSAGSFGTPVSAAALPATPAVAMQPPKNKHTLAKIVISVMVVLFLIAGGIVGTGIYIAYRIKKKAEKVEQTYKKALAEAASSKSGEGESGSSPDLGKLIGALGKAVQSGQSGSDGPDFGKLIAALGQAGQDQAGGSPDLAKLLASLGHSLQGPGTGGNVVKRPAGTCPAVNQKALVSYMHDAASTSIPLVAGLTLTDVWTPTANQPDIEILTTVNSINGDAVQVTGKRLVGRENSSTRDICTVDLLNAHEYETQFGPNAPNTIPGATMFTLSRAMFSDLKAGRSSEFTFYDAYNDPSGGYDLRGLRKGTISRVETSDVPYSMIVNGAQKSLPTLHANGTLGNMTFELWVLDDINNPLVLNFKSMNSPFHITYVKITFPEKKEVEQQLAQTGHADIYGIYFDFDKATPKPESAPVLKEIAQALKDNPNWKLEIAGHTDNVGGNDYNMSLSDKRAQGVMQSLVTQYGIPAERLTAKGFGDTEPKATNDTAEGRALNRRVELVRD